MNKNVKVSVIVVSLNTLSDFKKTIDSINSQKYKNFEIIVIDGNSSDGTIEEIKNKKNYFSNYLIEKDEGIYDAMNKGIDFINSEWTIFLNSGDTFFDDNVLLTFSLIDKNNYDIVYGKTAIDNLNILYSDNPKKIDNNFILMPFCHQSCFVKSSLLKKKFDLEYKASSDFDFFLTCYKNKKIFFYTDNFFAKVKSGGLSDKKRQLVFNENIEILKKNNLNFEANFIYLYKIKNVFFSFIKKIIPKIILIILLKIKNKKNLIKK